MTDHDDKLGDRDPFAAWYRAGEDIPVCHPIPSCSARVSFPREDEMQWIVENHRTGERTIETFRSINHETEEIDYE